MKVIMISGAYRSDTLKGRQLNIKHAKEKSIELWQKGYAVITPHLNTSNFDGYCDDEIWLKGYLEILKRCDAIFVLNNWQNSSGTKAEIELAKSLKKEIIFE